MSEKSVSYVVGIDLGTTNSALAYLRADDRESGVATLAVAQQTGPNQISRQHTLPSFVYIPVSGETAAALPWTVAGTSVVGDYAKQRAAETPDRVIASAKSWLCASHMDRHAAILPWRSEITDGKLSPIAASRLYLDHLRAAFRHDRQLSGDDVALDQCTVVLTVPASFDDAARHLTHAAAKEAGLGEPILLEEPLAAMYAWLGKHERTWRKEVTPGDVILVCDVGGGTCDFSLIAVGEQDGELQLSRISVGDHLLLGGDNMDLALAYLLKKKLEDAGHQLDHWQFLSLVATARASKERLFTDDAVQELPIAVASRSSSLFASTLTTSLTRDEVAATIVEGFLPRTDLTEQPRTRRSIGIQTAGLHYESDPAISRHLARFLRRSAQNVTANPALSHLSAKIQGEALLPTQVLFNGGVFKAAALRERILDLLAAWSGATVRELSGYDAELAVAQGAAYYGAMRRSGRGMRIQSGTARSYYLGLEEAAPAVPGVEPRIRGLCIVPQGTEEGTELGIQDQQFGLVVGEPVDFRLYSSTIRSGDKVGVVVDDADAALDDGGLLSLTLPASAGDAGKVIPVSVDALVNETGVLQIYMNDAATDRKWHLEFNLRSHEQ